VEFDPGGKELPHMVINNFVLEDCSYNDTSSEIIFPLCDLRHFGQCLISGGFRGGQAGSGPPFGDGLTPSLTVLLVLVNAKF